MAWLARCESTNDEALSRLDEAELVAVGADEQTGGRGRRGRRWRSPAGGLYLSWIARPGFEQALGGALPLLAGVAVAEACAARGVPTELKWPNDVLVGGRKLCGVLCEARPQPQQAFGWVAVVGVGVNLRSPEAWPPEVPATALEEHAAEVPAPRALAVELCERMQRWLDRVAEGGLSPLIEAWEETGPRPGVRLRRGDTVGVYDGLAPDGGLRLATETGVFVVHAGDVERADG